MIFFVSSPLSELLLHCQLSFQDDMLLRPRNKEGGQPIALGLPLAQVRSTALHHTRVGKNILVSSCYFGVGRSMMPQQNLGKGSNLMCQESSIKWQNLPKHSKMWQKCKVTQHDTTWHNVAQRGTTWHKVTQSDIKMATHPQPWCIKQTFNNVLFTIKLFQI